MATLGLSAATQAAVTNPSFELPGGLDDAQELLLNPGDTNLVGWTIGGTAPVSYLRHAAVDDSTQGIYSLGFNRHNASSGAWIEQSVSTPVGVAQVVQFRAGRLGGVGALKLTCTLSDSNGTIFKSLTVEPPVAAGASAFSIRFTPATAVTTIRFTDISLATAGADLVLDSVHVRNSVGPFPPPGHPGLFALRNGTFDLPGDAIVSDQEQIPVGDPRLVAWEVGGATNGITYLREQVTNNLQQVETNQAIVFNSGGGTGAWIEQRFYTFFEFGEKYRIAFKAIRNSGESPVNLTVTVKSHEGHDLLVTTLDPSAQNEHVLMFTPATGISVVRFTDSSPAAEPGTIPGTIKLDDIEVTKGEYPAEPGDFNGDGHSDLLWQHTAGRVRVSLSKAGGFFDSKLISALPNASAWKVIASADMNKDGENDLLVRDASGTVVVRFLRGTQCIGSTVLRKNTTGVSLWTLAAAGDLNNDSFTDLLWRRSDGQLVVWYMRKTKLLKSVSMTGSANLNPKFARTVGLLDVNSDGSKDIIWEHSNGVLYVSYVNAATVSPRTIVTTKSTTQRARGVTDANRDGQLDVVLENAGGSVSSLAIGPNGQTSTADLEVPRPSGTGWRLVGPR